MNVKLLEDYPEFKIFKHAELDYLQHLVLNDSMSKMSGIELQVRKRTTKVFVADVKMAAVCLHCLHNEKYCPNINA